MLKLFVILYLLYLAANVYIGIRGCQALKPYVKKLRMLLPIVQLTAVGCTAAAFLIEDKEIPFAIAHFIHTFGYGWLVVTLYLTTGLLIFEVARVFNKRFKNGFIPSLILTTIILTYGYINYLNPSEKVINIVINKPINNQQKKLKIAALSDVHLGNGTNLKRLQRCVEAINRAKPDLILIAGDLIDSSVTPVEQSQMEHYINQLEAPGGIYMVLGNHEYIGGIKRSIEWIEKKTKIQLLCDETITTQQGVVLVGRNDRRAARKSLQALTQTIDKTQPIIILDHQPTCINEAIETKVDMQISGHTHNGQIVPLNLITNRLFDLSYGYRKEGSTHLYVSSGLALWGPPFRIGSESEWVLFDITFKK